MRLAGSPFSTGRVLGSSTGLGTTVAADFVNLNEQYYRLLVCNHCVCVSTKNNQHRGHSSKDYD